ncbi:MAG: hypothetical protein WA655_11750 [Candidatus Korobacteraceae bacterium]
MTGPGYYVVVARYESTEILCQPAVAVKTIGALYCAMGECRVQYGWTKWTVTPPAGGRRGLFSQRSTSCWKIRRHLV